MANVEWVIQGLGWNNCNCAWGCPCQFNALPTTGNCRALCLVHIDKGHFGKVKLDGLNFAATVAWPGPIHLGNGTLQAVIDERAKPEQRAALEAIAQGRETDAGATIFQVFSTTYSTVLETLYKPFEADVSIDKRKVRLRIPGLVESSGESIKNPVTGAEHRAKVSLPNGFEYREAEYVSGTTRSQGAVALDLKASHAHINRFHWSTHGYVS
ncbi:MAG: DUF1326 domain-containing protein [Stenotrophobium sp.]